MNVYHVTGSPCPKPNLIRLLIAAIISFFGRPQSLSAQLKAGDEIPAAIWSAALKVANHPEGKATIRLADYKDKLIVLDFWATWCTACTQKMPELYKVQQEMKDSVAALLVNTSITKDDAPKVEHFLKKRSNAYNLTSVVEDTLLMSLFPERSFPHYALVKNGRVVQVATAYDMAAIGLRAAIVSGGSAVIQAPVFAYDDRQPLFKDGNGGPRPAYVYGSLLTRYLPGVHGGGSRDTDEKGLVTRLSYINVRMIDLFRFAYPEFFRISRGRTIFKQADTSLFPESGKEEDIYYTYEMETPPVPYEKAQRLMQADLERYFSLKINRSRQALPCWVLKAVSPQKVIQNAKGQPRETNMYEKLDVPVYYNNDQLGHLLKHLEEVNNEPFIDETGIADPVTLNLPANLRDIKALQDSLTAQGFKLVKESRIIDVVTIADKTNH